MLFLPCKQCNLKKIELYKQNKEKRFTRISLCLSLCPLSLSLYLSNCPEILSNVIHGSSVYERGVKTPKKIM